MTSRISFVIGVAVVALTVGAPSALGKGQPVSQPAMDSQAYKALVIRSEALNKKYGLGEFEAAQHRALRLRSEALNEKYGLGEFAPSGVPGESAEHRALRLRSEGMNEKYGVGGSVSGSGTDIEWAQIGVGFGMAIVFVVGLGLAVRVTRVRTLAH